MRKIVLIGFISLLVGVGCGSSSKSDATLVVSVDGAAVQKDAQDGRLDRDWSCGSLRAALARYSPAAMNAAGAYRAAARACDQAINRVDVAMDESGVRRSMGSPEAAVNLQDKRCWLYTWPRTLASPNGGSARICFKGNRVSLVQRQLAPLN
jgi:hypothetical protein